MDAAAKLAVCAQIRKKALACVPHEETSSHHHHEEAESSAASFNRLKCSVLLENIKGLIAQEKKNPSWTTSVLFSHDSLQQAAAKTADPFLIQQELIDHGILSKFETFSNNNNNSSSFGGASDDNNSEQQQQQQSSSSSSITNEAIFSLHHRTRLFALSRLGDLEVLVLNSSMNALTEHSSNGSANVSNTASPLLRFSSKQQQQTFSPTITSTAVNNNKEKEKESGKRRSRSESNQQQNQQQQNKTKQQSPKIQSLPTPTTTTTQQNNNNNNIIILPPGISTVFSSLISSAKEELFGKR
jgi:hypothetical protein